MLRLVEKAFQFFWFDTLLDASYIPLNGSNVRQITNTQESFFYSVHTAIEV
jgi:hypothetical protein